MSEHSFVSTMTVDSGTVLDYASAYIESELKSKHTSTKYLKDFRDAAFKKNTNLRELLTSLYDLVECNRSCMIYALVYMDRLKQKGYFIRYDTVRPTVCVALLLAQKAVLDVSVTTKELARCLQFVQTETVARMEKDMLHILNYKLYVHENEWDAMCRCIETCNVSQTHVLISVNADLKTISSYLLSLEKAKKVFIALFITVSSVPLIYKQFCEFKDVLSSCLLFLIVLSSAPPLVYGMLIRRQKSIIVGNPLIVFVANVIALYKYQSTEFF
mmetsp:Transcript_19138/g.27811  ORF Transcript_19138/g.27811 Transcript_19138/m.27811 type:complete len:272 (+) Transcript_19138:4568-5383(+)